MKAYILNTFHAIKIGDYATILSRDDNFLYPEGCCLPAPLWLWWGGEQEYTFPMLYIYKEKCVYSPE